LFIFVGANITQNQYLPFFGLNLMQKSKSMVEILKFDFGILNLAE
jgi:hypothetical protein